MLSTRADRTGRGVAAAAAAIATFVAAFSHSVANAEPAPLLGVLLALVCAVPVCIALAGRTLSWVRLALGIGLSQFVFHGLLQIGLGGGSFSVGMASHTHGAPAYAALNVVGDATSGYASHAEHTGAIMWFAHLLAAIVTVLAVGAGERALLVILGLGRLRRVAELFAWVPVATRARRAPLAAWCVTSERLACLAATRRRGPPFAA